jgi:hypothetical protein
MYEVLTQPINKKAERSGVALFPDQRTFESIPSIHAFQRLSYSVPLQSVTPERES